MRVPAFDFKTRLDDMRPLNRCSGNEFKTTSQDGDCCSNALLDLSTNGGILGKPENKEHNSFSFFFFHKFRNSKKKNCYQKKEKPLCSLFSGFPNIPLLVDKSNKALEQQSPS